MIPILYAKNETAFSHNGIGHLTDIISASVTEERNGSFEMTFTYPVTGAHFSEITEGAIVKAKPNETSNSQLFRVYKTSRPIGGIITVNAEHISYDLRGLPCMGYTSNGTSASAAMNTVFSACPISNGFSAWTDISSLLAMNIAEPRSLRNFCGGQEGSVLDVFGGEFEWDNYIVKLHGARGADNGVVLNYGKNLTQAKQEKNIQETYTHFCPYAKYTDTEGTEHVVTLPEKVIQLVNPADIGHSRAYTLDITSEFPSNTSNITADQLRTKAQSYIAKHSLGVPKVNLKVSFVQIWDSPEYEQFKDFEHVRLCDTVTVRFSALGINASAKVVKTTFDVLTERFSSIELGTLKSTLATTVVGLEEEVENAVNSTQGIRTDVTAQINEATQAITGNSGGYVVLYPARNPSEIMIMDTADINTAQKVWRWNSAGLGYSSTGVSGSFDTAITADGKIVADFITTGALNAIDIMACTISGGTMNINDKFIVDAEGNATIEGSVTATSGEIGGCSIVDGVLQVPAANVSGQFTADQIDADGITASNVSLSGSIHATEGTFEGTVDTSTAIIDNATIGQMEADDINVNRNVVISSEGGLVTPKIKGTANTGIQTIEATVLSFVGREYDSTIGKEVITCTMKLASAPTNNSKTTFQVFLKGYVMREGDPYRVHIDKTVSGTVVYTSDTSTNVTFSYNVAKIDSDENFTDFVVQSATFKNNSTAYSLTFTPPVQSGNVLVIEETDIMPSIAATAQGAGQNIGSKTLPFYRMYARAFTNVSSREFKRDIQEYDERHERFFDALKPCTYKYKEGSEETHFGMILDEVGAALEKSDLTAEDFGGYCIEEDGLGGLAYTEFISLCIWEIQKLKKRVEELEKEKKNG